MSREQRFEPATIYGLGPELAMAKLSGGRHGLPRSDVDRNQRGRIVMATLEMLPRDGFHGITVARVARTAGVSSTCIYDQFVSKERCFLEVLDLALGWLHGHIADAVNDEKRLDERVEAGASAFLSLLASNPAVAHLIAIESLRVGGAARDRRAAFLVRLTALLFSDEPEPPVSGSGLLLGSVLSMVGAYVDAGEPERLTETTPDVVRYLLSPYRERRE